MLLPFASQWRVEGGAAYAARPTWCGRLDAESRVDVYETVHLLTDYEQLKKIIFFQVADCQLFTSRHMICQQKMSKKIFKPFIL